MTERYNNRYKIDWETAVFLLFLGGMAVYYGWRMFALTPWYDELYTYYYFISRGPVYAAIHWPLPNNHIGYSVLSACLGIFGNSAVALRGVAWLCSLGSLIQIFRIGRRCFGHGAALMPVFLYAGMHMTNQLAVQGRGYSLVTFCYLTAVWELLQITKGNETGVYSGMAQNAGGASGASSMQIKNHVLFGISLIMALYAIPSSVYVVIPVCVSGGILFLVRRDYGRLMRLVLTSIASAVCVVGLYGVVWLAIGSNLLVKTEGGVYYGMGHGAVILQAPFKALRTGIDYMLATPYIQSVGRDGFAEKFIAWLKNLLNEYYKGGWAVLAALMLIGIACVIIKLVKRWRTSPVHQEAAKKNHDCDLFVEVYLLTGLVGLPLMLTVQCSLPYYRVFSFAGALVAFMAAWLWQAIGERLQDIKGRRALAAFRAAGSAVCGILCAVCLCTPSYRAQYGGREAAIEDAYSQMDLSRYDKIAVTDCDQEYLLLFLYDIGEERLTRNPEDADVVLADKYLLLSYDTDMVDWSGDDWKLYLSPEQFQQYGVEGTHKKVYENDRFVLYAVSD